MKVAVLKIRERGLWGDDEYIKPPFSIMGNSRLRKICQESLNEHTEWFNNNDVKFKFHDIMQEMHYETNEKISLVVIDIPDEIVPFYKLRFPEIKTVDFFQ